MAWVWKNPGGHKTPQSPLQRNTVWLFKSRHIFHSPVSKGKYCWASHSVMLGRGWQWVEKTGNRARAREYSTEEKQGVWGSDGGQARQSSHRCYRWSNVGGPGLVKIRMHWKWGSVAQQSSKEAGNWVTAGKGCMLPGSSKGPEHGDGFWPRHICLLFSLHWEPLLSKPGPKPLDVTFRLPPVPKQG